MDILSEMSSVYYELTTSEKRIAVSLAWIHGIEN